MSESPKIDNKLIAKLYAELIEDVQVNYMNVRDKAMLVSTIRAKWVMMFFSEKETMKKLKNAKTSIIKQASDNLETTNVEYRSLSRLRLEEMACKNEPKIIKVEKLIGQQSDVIQFMEYALNIVSDFNFTVKHALDAIKLEQS